MSARDTRPAVGRRGGPAPWRRAREDAGVAGARRQFMDGRWSYLFKRGDTRYAEAEPEPGQVAAAAERARTGPPPDDVRGPFIKPPVWTWEVPVYLWVGGIASGSAFVAHACEVAGDRRSAATARAVAVGAVMPAPLLLMADLGRPARFLNMLRIFKPRSPMNLGAWCLMAFHAVGTAAVGADLIGRPRAARALGSVNAVLGGYLGSYTGVLLASTSVPLWSRSRLFLGPVFVCTASATGAAAVRLALVGRGLPTGHPTRRALGTIETAAIASELCLSAVNERRLGRLARPLQEGRPGLLLRTAKLAVGGGLALRLAGRRLGPHGHNVASVAYLLGGLAFRFAWVEAGKASAADHEAVAAAARGRHERTASKERAPVRLPASRAWSATVRRASLAIERAARVSLS